jgi:hypothetical protein
MVLIKSISKCGQCTRSTCRNCTNYIGTVTQSDDTETMKMIVVCLGVISLIVLLMFI